MLIEFIKMHSLGNDFVIIDGIRQKVILSPTQLRKIAHRNFGVGCDQVLILEPPYDPRTEFFFKIYNQDGSEASQCINGVRCAAKFAYLSGLVTKEAFYATGRGGRVALANKNEKVVVSISSELVKQKQLAVPRANTSLHLVELGNLHLVYVIPEEVAGQNLAQLASSFVDPKQFPEGANFSVIKLHDDKVSIRTYERGVGETLACGSAAIAAFKVINSLGMAAKTFSFANGNLEVQLEQDGSISNAGRAISIFSGKLLI